MPSRHSTGAAYLDDGATSDAVTVNVRVRDDDQPTVFATASAVLTVANASIFVGAPFTRTITFTDPGTLDAWTAEVNWGDGAGFQSLGAVSASFPTSHTYATPGVRTVAARVTDDDGGVGTASFQLTVDVPVTATTGHFDQLGQRRRADAHAGGLRRRAASDVYSTGVGYGWLNGPALGFDRTSPAVGALYRGGARGSGLYPSFADTFRADLANGSYQVTVLLGDAQQAVGNIDILVNGSPVNPSPLATASGQFVAHTFTTTVSGGNLQLKFRDNDQTGDTFWAVNAVVVRATASVGGIALTNPAARRRCRPTARAWRPSTATRRWRWARW